MKLLLIAVLIEVPLVALGLLCGARRLLSVHDEVMAAVIGRKAQDVRKALADAEGRVSAAARGGVVSRSGPARLRD